jgi:hypothetical protein
MLTAKRSRCRSAQRRRLAATIRNIVHRYRFLGIDSVVTHGFMLFAVINIQRRRIEIAVVEVALS